VFQRETGLKPVELGIQHYSPQGGGYHEGNDLLAAGGRANTDYSKRESIRDRPGTDGASAIDIGYFDVVIVDVATGVRKHVTLFDMNRWLERNWSAPDAAWIREIIYSLDGKTVRRLDRLGLRSSGDNSHLSHTHVSGFRDEEETPKAPLFERFWREMKGSTAVTQDEFNHLLSNNPDFLALIWREHSNVNMLDQVAGGPLAGEENVLVKHMKRMQLELSQIIGLVQPHS
jgi:hypothetical protein